MRGAVVLGQRQLDGDGEVAQAHIEAVERPRILAGSELSGDLGDLVEGELRQQAGPELDDRRGSRLDGDERQVLWRRAACIGAAAQVLPLLGHDRRDAEQRILDGTTVHRGVVLCQRRRSSPGQQRQAQAQRSGEQATMGHGRSSCSGER